MSLKIRKTASEEIGDAIEYFESAYYVVPVYNSEAGKTTYHKGEVRPARSVRKLKQRRDDYRPGSVKTYTKAEIEEYERESHKLP